MINSIELRRGNLVYAYFPSNIGTVIGCGQREDGKMVVQLKTTHKEDVDIVLEGDIKPIPITEELLLKCGFEKCGINKESIAIFTPCGKALVYKDGYIIFCGITIETKKEFLHELQDLYYALTRQELEVNL